MRLGRIPIRIRMAAFIAIAMSGILLLTGAFTYLRVRSNLDEAINDGLRTRADDVAALAAQSDDGLDEDDAPRLTEAEDSFVQVLGPDAAVIDATPGAEQPALSPKEVGAIDASTLLEGREIAGIEGQARLLARPVEAEGTQFVVVVGATVSDRNEALRGLLGAFAIGGPIAVLIVSGAGYLLAGLSLRPVEAMRKRADEVTLEDRAEKLPLPEANDEIRWLGVTLNRMLERLRESFERERAFVADASHELRTPLSVLRAELEVTLSAGGHDVETTASLRTAIEEVDQLTALADDLLLLARSQDGEFPLKVGRVQLVEVAETLVARFQDPAEAKGRAVVAAVAPEIVLDADPLRIRQAIRNLIDNSLKHGGGTITVSAREVGASVEIRVSDEGQGFPPEFAERAFERFSRADQARGRGGAGLGLAIVRAIARAHGGDVRIEALKPGAHVVLVLPRGA